MDLPTPQRGAGTGASSDGIAAPPPGGASIRPPTNLTVVSNTLALSAQTPVARVELTWRAAEGIVADRYLVQRAQDAAFTVQAAVFTAAAPRYTLEVPAGTGATWYVRVQAQRGGLASPWSNVVSFVPATDTTPPGAVAGLAAVWAPTGDLLITFTNPTSPNFRDARLRIRSSVGGTTIWERAVTTGRYVWTLAEQAQATGGVYDTSVEVVVTTRSVAGVESSPAVTLSTTRPAPAAPGSLATSWASDTAGNGTAAADLVITWSPVSHAAGYLVTIDGVARRVGAVDRFVYPLAQNASENSGADPTLSIAVQTIDSAGQLSPTASISATNHNPPATTISAAGAPWQIALAIAPSAAQDLAAYRIRSFVNGSGTPTDTWDTLATAMAYEPPTSGSWQFDVRVVDRFGQVSAASALTGALNTQTAAEFIAALRARVTYSDSVGTAPATLDGLKDGVTGVNVVTYTSSTPYRWTQADRQLVDRNRVTSLASSASATYYYALSRDGATWSYYAGGTATGGVWAPVAQASEAAAQTAATTLAAGVWRVNLPGLAEARFYRLFHRNTGASYALREFFPRSLVEAEDGVFETLSALSANLGNVTAGTITGILITGSTFQSTAGDLVIDNDGMQIAGGTGFVNSVQFMEGTTVRGQLRGYLDDDTGWTSTEIVARNAAGTTIQASVTANSDGQSVLWSHNGSTLAPLLTAQSGGVIISADLSVTDDTVLTGGLNVGADLGANSGQIRAVRNTAGTSDVINVLELYRRTTVNNGAAAGIGQQIPLNIEDDANLDRPAGTIRAQLSTATSASWVGRLSFFAGNLEGIRIQGGASGNPAISFFGGTSPQTRRALPAAATDLASALTLLNAIRTYLIDLNLAS